MIQNCWANIVTGLKIACDVELLGKHLYCIVENCGT